MERPNLKDRLTGIVDELVSQGVSLAQARREFERQFIVASLKSNDGNLCRSARSLGVHRNTLRNKVSDLGIEASDVASPRSARRSRRRSADARNPL
jgi:two-component system, NtrC family, nitrogen regulation response regulator NtrX